MEATPFAGFVTVGGEKRFVTVVETKFGADKALALKFKTRFASPKLKAVEPETLTLTTIWVVVSDKIS